MSTIQGITFDNQVVTAKDHGMLFHCLLTDGVVSGCTVSKTATSITIAKGYLLVAGRLIRLTAAQTLSVATPTSAGYVRVILTINLAGTATQDSFSQVSLSTEFATAVSGFRELTQGDINSTDTLYEYELCICRALTSGISSVYRSPTKATVDLNDIGTVAVSGGGTGKSTLTKNALLLGNGTDAVTLLSPTTSGYILMAQGSSSAPAFKAQTAITKVGTITSGVWNGSAIPMAYGGTGATTGPNGLYNMLQAGATILSSYQYGSTLPSSGTAGRLFFQTVG